MIDEDITLHQALEYEVSTSWWAWFMPAQDLVARYMSWKTQRKWKRYKWFKERDSRNVEKKWTTGAS